MSLQRPIRLLVHTLTDTHIESNGRFSERDEAVWVQETEKGPVDTGADTYNGKRDRHYRPVSRIFWRGVRNANGKESN